MKYDSGIGPGVYDIHSARIPSIKEIVDKINKMFVVLEKIILWVKLIVGSRLTSTMRQS